MGEVVLSARMQAVADLVTRGNRVCDVGCDHGFVSIYLAQQGVSPQILAMDVRSGPLQAAREHILAYGLEHIIETRLSDGLHNFECGEADSLICAGMGGRLMMRILTDDREKTDSFRELILQPQSELEWFRRTLHAEGYCVSAENMIEEDGKFYPMMRAVKAETKDGGSVDENLQKLEFRYGSLLLRNRSPVLIRFLEKEQKNYEKILDSLKKQGIEKEERKNRYGEIEALWRETRRALSMMQQKG